MEHSGYYPLTTMNGVIDSLSNQYPHKVILLVDEIATFKQPDWSTLRTSDTVDCMFALNPGLTLE